MAKGAPRVVITAAAGNTAAQALFGRLGFRRTMVEMTREADGAGAGVPRPLTLLNGSLGGAGGNTAAVLAPLATRLRAATQLRVVHLAGGDLSDEELERLLYESAGFVFATGTYWDAWGSPLQRFLERATRFEGGAPGSASPPRWS